MNIEENIVNNIMDYHGDIYKMLPEWNFPENIKRCLRMDNWGLTTEYHSGRGGRSKTYYIVIKIDTNNLWSVFKNDVNVEYSYPTKYGFMDGFGQIIDIKNDLIQIGKYKLKLDRFWYLRIKHRYKIVTIHSTDD